MATPIMIEANIPKISHLPSLHDSRDLLKEFEKKDIESVEKAVEGITHGAQLNGEIISRLKHDSTQKVNDLTQSMFQILSKTDQSSSKGYLLDTKDIRTELKMAAKELNYLSALLGSLHKVYYQQKQAEEAKIAAQRAEERKKELEKKRLEKMIRDEEDKERKRMAEEIEKARVRTEEELQEQRKEFERSMREKREKIEKGLEEQRKQLSMQEERYQEIEEVAKNVEIVALDASVCKISKAPGTPKPGANSLSTICSCVWLSFSPSVITLSPLRMPFSGGVWICDWKTAEGDSVGNDDDDLMGGGSSFFQAMFGIVALKKVEDATVGGDSKEKNSPALSSFSEDYFSLSVTVPYVTSPESYLSQVNATIAQQSENFSLKSYGAGYSHNGDVWQGGRKTKGNSSYKLGDTIGVQLDMNERTIVFLKNGTPQPVYFLNAPGDLAFCARGNQENVCFKVVSIRRTKASVIKQLEEKGNGISVGWVSI